MASATTARLTRDARIPETTEAMRGALTGVGDAGVRVATLQIDLSRAFEDLSASVRRIGRLADYLERHPESILAGRKPRPAKED